MHRRQYLTLRSGVLLMVALLLPLLAAEAQLDVSNKSKNMSPSTSPTVDVPANATLNFDGRAWECKYGYQRSGNACVTVDVPANATLDYDGHAWKCKRDYRRAGSACEKIAALHKTAINGASVVQESSANPQQQNDSKEEIRQLQEQLKEAGFDPGPTDGILGSRTINALHRYLDTR